MGLRNFFDNIEPHFMKGGKWERYFPIYEMVESFAYTPKTVTTAAPHARSYIDMKRIMTYVVIATIPCILFGWYNTGLQVNSAIAVHGASGWRTWIVELFGVGFDSSNIFRQYVPWSSLLFPNLYNHACCRWPYGRFCLRQ